MNLRVLLNCCFIIDFEVLLVEGIGVGLFVIDFWLMMLFGLCECFVCMFEWSVEFGEVRL